jgi:Ion channel
VKPKNVTIRQALAIVSGAVLFGYLASLNWEPLEHGRNAWLINVFLAYLGVVLGFAVVYHQLYKSSPDNFAFNADVHRAQKATFKSTCEEEIRYLTEVLSLLSPLLEGLSTGALSMTFRGRFLLRKPVVETPNHRFEMYSVAYSPSPMGPVVSFQHLLIRDENRKLIGNFPIYHELPKNSEEFKEGIADLIERLKKRLHNRRMDLEGLGRDVVMVWTFWDFLYFSTITQTTVGYGDILPNRTPVRIAVIVQILIGLLILGIVINLVFQGPQAGAPSLSTAQ